VNGVLLNPPSDLLGRVNAVLSGRAKQYSMRPFAGPLSIKTVIRGSAAWRTSSRRYVVEPGDALVLNDGEEYETEVDSPQPVETFCVFFARGFVEDADRAASTSSAALLDSGPPPPVQFIERMHFDERLLGLIAALRTDAGEPQLVALAIRLAALHQEPARCVASLPALRMATREELARRIRIATEFIHANISSPLLLADIASAATMSPFHLHRTFSSFHGLPPHAYIVRLRFERARSLLRTTRLPVSEVAFSCGFASLGSFTSGFTRRFGVPPARFRKNGEDVRAGSRLSSAHE
jgi:AraC family transcriptional regulator